MLYNAGSEEIDLESLKKTGLFSSLGLWIQRR